jgi:hypothetical protein
MSNYMQVNSAVKAEIFNQHSPRLYSAGMATLPLSGKEPLVAGFNKWKRRPGRVTFEKWRQKFPDANVGYVPGLTGKGGIVVIDDDGGAAERIVEVFGATPGMVTTRRGKHYLYRAPKGFGNQRINLKGLGINADWKAGNDIVVGPGSIHESGHIYVWDGCDERVLHDLPTLDFCRLAEFRGDMASGLLQADKRIAAGFRDGSRKLALNDWLWKHAGSVEGAFELVNIARGWNEDLVDRGIIKLEDETVVQVARTVWGDFQKKGEVWHGRRATVRSTVSEIDELARYGKNAASAYMLLMKLRGEHGARMQRGETFMISPVAMAKKGTIPHWTKYEFTKARDLLLKAGKISVVVEANNAGNGRRATQYRLVEARGRGAV